MDKPCEICGDVGWVDAIVICSKCNVTREHMYCMRIMHEGDREEWVCDECDSNQKPSFKQAPSEQSSSTRMRFMVKKPPQNSKVQYLAPEEIIGLESGAARNKTASPSKSCVARRPLVNNRPCVPKVQTIPSFVRPIKPNPPVGPSGHKKPLNWNMPPALKDKKWSAYTEKENYATRWQDSPVPKHPSGRITEVSNVMMRKETNGPARQQCGESPTAKHVTFETPPKPVAESDNMDSGHTRKSIQCLPAVSSVNDAEQVCMDTPTAKCVPFDNFSQDDSTVHSSLFVQSFPPLSPGNNVCAEAQLKSTDSKGKDSSSVTIAFDSYLPNHPAVSPSWKGTLKISNDVLPCTLLDEIQAVPPCKVHSEVYKLSKQLPDILHLELIRRQNSWVEIFKDNPPGVLDIGLYFLQPLMGVCEQSYCSLLDYLDSHDLILTTCIPEAELFVFSSIHLPENSRKINQQHFLWGLFRPSKVNKTAVASDIESWARVDSVHPVQEKISEEIDAEDMDIDMLGGHEVGRVDIRVAKPRDNDSVDQRGPSSEMIASPLSTAGSAVDISSVKIKRECSDDMGKSLSLPASPVDYGVEFEEELQRSFDKFAALMQVKEPACLKMEIKEEVNSSC